MGTPSIAHYGTTLMEAQPPAGADYAAHPKEAGYSHYRMGSPDMAHTESVTRQAFPKGGDVAFVYFRESYLELVQVEDAAVAAE